MTDPDEEAIVAACKAAPRHVTPEQVKDTLRVWQPIYGGTLTPEDAVEICINVHRLFDVLFSNKPEKMS